LLDFYKKLIAFRKNHNALVKGSINFIYSDNDKRSFAFERILGDEKIICAFNVSDNENTIKMEKEVNEIYPECGNDFTTTIKLKPNSFKVFKIR
jgi:glycosidase